MESRFFETELLERCFEASKAFASGDTEEASKVLVTMASGPKECFMGIASFCWIVGQVIRTIAEAEGEGDDGWMETLLVGPEGEKPPAEIDALAAILPAIVNNDIAGAYAVYEPLSKETKIELLSAAMVTATQAMSTPPPPVDGP